MVKLDWVYNYSNDKIRSRKRFRERFEFIITQMEKLQTDIISYNTWNTRD